MSFGAAGYSWSCLLHDQISSREASPQHTVPQRVTSKPCCPALPRINSRACEPSRGVQRPTLMQQKSPGVVRTLVASFYTCCHYPTTGVRARQATDGRIGISTGSRPASQSSSQCEARSAVTDRHAAGNHLSCGPTGLRPGQHGGQVSASQQC